MRAVARQRGESGSDEAGPLERLEDILEGARSLPEPQAYRRSAGDPLEVLNARIHGDLGDAIDDADGASLDGGEGREPGETTRRQQLGAALDRSLRERPLAGPVRAEVAARLASLMEGQYGDELEEIWELIVFGASGVGTDGKAG